MTEHELPPVGAITWADLTVVDAPAVRDFYAAVCGWTPTEVAMGDYADYAMAPEGGDPVAGVCHARGDNAGLPAQWILYVTVENLDRSLAECTARAIDDGARARRHAAFLKKVLVAVDGKADFLALGLVGDRQLRQSRQSPGLLLGRLAQGELEPREHVLGYGPEHVGLVLVPVRTASDEGPAAQPNETRVVPGGHGIETALVGQPDQRRKTARIAGHAGVGRLAGQIALDERRDDLRREVVREVQYLKRHADVGGAARRALQGAGRATAVPVGTRPRQHCGRLERTAFPDEPQRRNGAVHAAAQGDEGPRSFGSDLRICVTSASRPLLTR